MGTLPWLKQNRLSPLAPTEDDERFLPSAASLAQQNFDARRAGANPGFAEAEELHAQDVAKQTGRNPLKEKQAAGANQQAFLDYLARISGEADSVMNTERERQSMAMAGAQAEDMKQAGINNIMASAMMGARNAPAQQQFMTAAQANPNQKAVAEQGKGFGEWLAKRYDIGKNAGEYNQAAYHDLMAEQNRANLEQRGAIAKREEKEFGLTLEQRKAEALQRAKDEANDRWLRKKELDARNQERTDRLSADNKYREDVLQLKREELQRKQDLDREKAKAHIAQKSLPPAALNDLAALAAAEKQIDALSELWDEKASDMSAGASQYVMNTDANLYSKELPSYIQSIGVGLEQGKLTDKDMPKYEKMLPKASDTKEQKAAKIDALRKQAAIKRAGIIDTYEKQGGYTSTPQTGAQQQTINIRDKSTGQVTPFSREEAEQLLQHSNFEVAP